MRSEQIRKTHELIGLKTIVEDSPDSSLKGIAGVVRDETKNTLRIETDRRILTVPKRNTTFLVEFSPSEVSTIQGDQISYRPEDRVKKGIGRCR